MIAGSPRPTKGPAYRGEPRKYTPIKGKGFNVEFLFKFPDIVDGKAHGTVGLPLHDNVYDKQTFNVTHKGQWQAGIRISDLVVLKIHLFGQVTFYFDVSLPR
jgi:hypothetical protein